jgi:hypothetical protein
MWPAGLRNCQLLPATYGQSQSKPEQNAKSVLGGCVVDWMHLAPEIADRYRALEHGTEHSKWLRI